MTNTNTTAGAETPRTTEDEILDASVFTEQRRRAAAVTLAAKWHAIGASHKAAGLEAVLVIGCFSEATGYSPAYLAGTTTEVPYLVGLAYFDGLEGSAFDAEVYSERA